MQVKFLSRKIVLVASRLMFWFREVVNASPEIFSACGSVKSPKLPELLNRAMARPILMVMAEASYIRPLLIRWFLR